MNSISKVYSNVCWGFLLSCQGMNKLIYLQNPLYIFVLLLTSVLSLWLQMISVIGSPSLQRYANTTEPFSSPAWVMLNTISTELKGKCKESVDRLLLLPTERKRKYFWSEGKRQEGKGSWVGWSHVGGSCISFGEACVWAAPAPSRSGSCCPSPLMAEQRGPLADSALYSSANARACGSNVFAALDLCSSGSIFVINQQPAYT